MDGTDSCYTTEDTHSDTGITSFTSVFTNVSSVVAISCHSSSIRHVLNMNQGQGWMYSTGRVTVGVRTSRLPKIASTVYYVVAVTSIVTKYWHNPCERTSLQTIMNPPDIFELMCSNQVKNDRVCLQYEHDKLLKPDIVNSKKKNKQT